MRYVDQHYRDTILNPVVFSEHADLLDASLAEQLGGIFADGAAPVWGITPGKGEVNVSKVRKMSVGDWVIFSGDNHLYFGGRIALMWQSAPLAERLWGTDENGSTWEYMYALTGSRGFDVPIGEVRAALQWEPKRNVQNVTILKANEVEIVQDLLSLDTDGELPEPPGNQGTGPRSPEVFDSELERIAMRLMRGEQTTLKRRLLPSHIEIGQCALCGRTLPRSLLIAAHIKKRACCTDEEKRDLSNIAMLACDLGCDALYEHGYIAVAADGDLLVSPHAAGIPDVADYIAGRLAGRTVTWWTETRSQYFHWHRTHTFKDSPPS